MLRRHFEWHESRVLCEWHCRARKMMIDSSRNEASANSNYYEGLDLEAKKRYDVKVATLGNLGDPYAARKKSSTSLEIMAELAISGVS